MSQDFKQTSETLVVTMAVGSEYQSTFERWHLPSWRDYCRRQGFDLHVIDQPIDRHVDLSRKSLHWQKLLIPSLPQFRNYERVIWVDADIVINLQGDEPLIDPSSLELLADLLRSEPTARMATRSASGKSRRGS